MTPELGAAIEGLYAVSARYAKRRSGEGCPCCVSAQDRAILHSKPLRAVGGKELGRYAFKALSTWGDADDLRFFLPRIFELMVEDTLGVDAEVVLGKLPYANWTEWPAAERAAITRFVDAWWAWALATEHADPSTVLSAIHAGAGEVADYLTRWDALLATQVTARAHLLELVSRLGASARLSPWMSAEATLTVRRWIVDPARSESLEQAILESSDPERAREELEALRSHF